MSGRPYEALRFANNIRGALGLRPATKLVDQGDPITDTITANAKSVRVSWDYDTVTATRGKTAVTRTLPMGASAFVEAYENGLLTVS